MKPVLVSDGGTGQAVSTLGAVRALAMAGRVAHVATSHPLSTAGWSRHCSRRVRVPTVEDPRAYADAIDALARSGRYDAVLLSSDAALLALDWSGAELVDKSVVAKRAETAGFAVTHEEEFDNGNALLEAAAGLTYPLAVKAVAKHEYTALNVWRAGGPADLEPARDYPDPLIVQEWLPGTLRGMSGVVWDGRLRAVLHQSYARTWPREAGVATHAVTVEPDRALEEKVTQVMAGHNGMFNVQYLGDHLIDVNPRVYGSVVVTAHAGINLPDLVARLVAGEEVGGPEPVRAPLGLRYRWIEGDVRSLLDARRAGVIGWSRLARELRPVRGTVHADFEWSDPGPLLARGAYAVRSRL
jgi:hypothetical protein